MAETNKTNVTQGSNGTINIDMLQNFLEKIIEKPILQMLGIQKEVKKPENVDNLRTLLSLMKPSN